ncbi:PREDICTED: protein CURVATURE THYLAKOID 1C, chloroplastic-like isoform X1 [Nelumbo nucifera]|uniref:Protein CURVATURE THYLAKOID 1C, chloroplastic-like isoform X1 n=1 Tax=Nelumbo nucifera TaxID=4432 RepID=A0A1U7ZAM1_NELNU|nr:PREDICTED: protein CURVATURE THYLAKOID 1C, chloroplastic-like isoform X1 [Nelumbo nucifera]XP_010249677.1 PREDICTED: protein CURVATURE THYLAKOID 1C, chloroplastic-like isoform X1 [Nelumbo nucifera]XP_010249678.1 PREDICTED: protein CURVATURE THYLAKOID 1C, chloroplastic-like isoform X1 [Nelumbo nucifera]
MASAITNLPPSFLFHGRKTLFRNVRNLPASAVREQKRHLKVVVKATGETPETSSSLSIVESVQDFWDKSEDRVALVGLGFAGAVVLWAIANLVMAIDKLPLIPNALEFIGIWFSWWFMYRYLLFKADREELFRVVNTSLSDILGL